MTDNAADPKAVKARGRKQKDLEDQWLDDLRALLKTDFGRRFLWSQLSNCNIWRTAFHTDTQVFAHNEGRRSVGVELMTRIIEADPQAWIQMQQEHLDAESKS